MKLQHYINHISLIIDKSGSMAGHAPSVIKVFDKELAYLKQRSVELNQETRISIYLFNNTIEVLTFDMDVMRFTSLSGHYKTSGQTALMDAVYKSVEDNRKLPELYGDHAFLQYVITDGMENASKDISSISLRTQLDKLPSNWTTACLVPNATAKFEAKKFGFEEDSIAIWDTQGYQAMEKVGQQMSQVMDNYMALRSTGVRGTKNLFTLSSEGLNKVELKEVAPNLYDVYPVRKEDYIKPYVESYTGEKYRVGSTYYQPVKPVKIQDYKNILVQDARNGRVFEGHNLRTLLGLPAETATVNPGSHKDWRIFVQSTSTNRRLFPETFILVRR